ncbi:MAG: helix-turn-helix domain-containing protein, partial [Planctomycetales bacterium]
WTIHQLTEVVRKALDATGYNGQSSGRIRQTPDLRTIRYYTTLGILDRPLEMRGRTAFYGQRHVLQLVALKQLQSQGMSLVQAQQALTSANDDQLRQWSRLPNDFWDRPSSEPSVVETPS